MFTVLVVEDDTQLNNLFCKTLSRNGYKTLSAADPKKGLEFLDSDKVDLIITDIMMPEMNGFEFVRLLREGEVNIPVMVISAKGDIVDKQSGFFAGADDYMVKPVDLQEMLLRVQALLRRAKSVSDRKLILGNTKLEYVTPSGN